MHIQIDLRVADEPNAHHWLDRIMYKVEDGWHVWDTTGGPDPEAFQTTTWISDPGRQGHRVSEMLVAAIRHDAWSVGPPGRRIRVRTHPISANDLTPEDATRLAEEPLTILVENRRSDGAFLERAMKELDHVIRRLWHRPGDPVRVDSVGGIGQMLDEVGRRTAGVSVRPRLVVMVDSDRTTPNDVPSPAALRLQRKCEKLGVPCWILAKRESENYLPRILLSERENVGVDHGHMVDAWDDLDDDQKDFVDMKNGLPDEPSEAEEALFHGLSIRSRELLSQGFGGRVYKCWTCWNVQAKNELIDRGRDDLEYGIALIRKEI